jgi:hypothetical protein
MSVISHHRVAALILTLVVGGRVDAQDSQYARFVSTDPKPTAPLVHASRVSVPIHIDGSLNESAWRTARPVTEFVQREPVGGAPATHASDVRMLVTDDAVIIGARLTDDPASMFSRDTAFGQFAVQGYNADYFEVAIDPHRAHTTALMLNVTPSGGRRSWYVSRNGERDESREANWESATHLGADGWTVEIRIPLSEFHVPAGDESWGVQFTRFSWQRQETDVFKYVAGDRYF